MEAMKAKEYAVMLDISSEKTFQKSLADMIDEFRKETVDLMNQRGSQSSDAGVAVLNEQDHKWIALCHILEMKHGEKVLKKVGFRELIRKITPFFMIFWTPEPMSED